MPDTEQSAGLVEFVGESVVIAEAHVTGGRHVRIVCDTLSFANNGWINTGFTTTASYGQPGLPAGNVTIIARTIRSLNLSAVGQQGGKGETGGKGSTGDTGGKGDPGPDAVCRKTASSSLRAGNGHDGKPGQRGGTGETGRPGKPGGAGGLVTIRHWNCAIDPAQTAAAVSGGAGGVGGDGGPGGDGGVGGPGGNGGLEADCMAGGKYGEDFYLDKGQPGPTGPRGPLGFTGSQGQAGPEGVRGKVVIEQFASDDESYAAIAAYLPTMSMRRWLRTAELHFLLNQRDEARTLLVKVKNTSRNNDELELASTLIERLENERNYFNDNFYAAPVELKQEPGGSWTLKNAADISEDLDRFRVMLHEATENERYRADQLYVRESAIRAYEFEKRSLDQYLLSLSTQLRDLPADLKAITDRIAALQAQALALKDRIVRILGDLARFPANVMADGEALIGNLELVYADLAAAIAAAASQNWLAAAGFLVGALGAMGKAADNAQGILNAKIALTGLLDRAKDELTRTQELIEQARDDLRKLMSREAEATTRQHMIEQTRTLLASYQQNQDPASLEKLRDQSREALWLMRVATARQLHHHRRYLDLRLGRNDGTKDIAPAGGIDEAFSSAHLLVLLSDVQNSLLDPPPPNITTWEVTQTAAELPDEFAQLQRGGPTNFSLAEPPAFLKDARVWTVKLKLAGDAGAGVSGHFKVSQDGVSVPSRHDANRCDLGRQEWVLRALNGESPRSDARFAARPLNATWTLTSLTGASPVSITWEFEVEMRRDLQPFGR